VHAAIKDCCYTRGQRDKRYAAAARRCRAYSARRCDVAVRVEYGMASLSAKKEVPAAMAGPRYGNIAAGAMCITQRNRTRVRSHGSEICLPAQTRRHVMQDSGGHVARVCEVCAKKSGQRCHAPRRGAQQRARALAVCFALRVSLVCMAVQRYEMKEIVQRWYRVRARKSAGQQWCRQWREAI